MTTTAQYYLLVPPNWNSPVRYSRKWRTSIQSGITGAEIRSAIFSWPRRTLTYRINTLKYSEQAYLKKILFNGLGKVVAVPFWQDVTALSAQASAGSSSFIVNEADYRNFEVGGLAVISALPSSYEIVTIASIIGDTIGITGTLPVTWPAGSAVYPMLKGRLTTGLEIGTSRRDLGEMDVSIMEAYDDAPTRHIGDDTAYSDFDSLPVFDLEGVLERIKQRIIRPTTLTEYFGKQVVFDQYTEAAFGFSGSFDLFSRSEIRDVLDFFDAQKGRWGNFYLPSNVQDLEITAAFGSADTVLTVTDIDFSTYWGDTNAGRAIIVFWPDGTWKAAEIESSGSGTIRLATPLGKAATSDEISYLMAAFLSRVRFDQDEIEIQYTTDGIGSIDLTFRSVKWSMQSLTTTTTTSTTTTSTTTTTTTTSTT